MIGMTTLTPRKHGPSLKNSLVGSAAVYKDMFDNMLLRGPDLARPKTLQTLRFKAALRPVLCEMNSTRVLVGIFAIVSQIPWEHKVCALDRKFRNCRESLRTAWMDLYDQLPDVTLAAFALNFDRRSEISIAEHS